MEKITEKQKSNIIHIMQGMKIGEIQWLKDYHPEERDFIIKIISNQDEKKSHVNRYCFTLNGEADKKNHTKFRKEKYEF